MTAAAASAAGEVLDDSFSPLCLCLLLWAGAGEDCAAAAAEEPATAELVTEGGTGGAQGSPGDVGVEEAGASAVEG
jgi:hypothetical protein